MNNQLISKIIKINNEACPDFFYDNPLLARSTAEALAKSFVKIFSSRQNNHMDKSLRLCVLENIRKLCRIEPYEHKNIDDSIVAMITDFYNKHIAKKDHCKNEIDTDISDDEKNLNQELDAFIVTEMKDVEMESSYKQELNPEVVQALLNLNNQGAYLDKLSTDLIHWDTANNQCKQLVTDLWTKENLHVCSDDNIVDVVAVKVKPELEKELINISSQILTDKDMNIDEIFSTNNTIQNIVKKCSMSPLCFQMTTGILNTIFITTNLNCKLHTFIRKVVTTIQSRMSFEKFISLYPSHLGDAVLLLEQDLNLLGPSILDQYKCLALEQLNKIKSASEIDFIMILSHYPQWSYLCSDS